MKLRIGIVKQIKARNANKKISIEPLRLFIMGGAGIGKLHLWKTICMFFMKTITLYTGSPDRPKVLILTPTVVAAINNDCTLPRLSEQNKTL